MFDLVFRLVLLTGLVVVAVAFIWLIRRPVRPFRRLSLLVFLPAIMVYVVFEVDLLISGDLARAELARPVLLSRIALGLTIVGWLSMALNIGWSEKQEAETRAAADPRKGERRQRNRTVQIERRSGIDRRQLV